MKTNVIYGIDIKSRIGDGDWHHCIEATLYTKEKFAMNRLKKIHDPDADMEYDINELKGRNLHQKFTGNDGKVYDLYASVINADLVLEE